MPRRAMIPCRAVRGVAVFAGLLFCFTACSHLHGHVADPAPLTIKATFCQSSRFIGGREYTVYSRGTGPLVLLLHEIPALTPECLRLASYIADRGFAVQVPLLFGKPPSPGPPSPLRGFLEPCLFKGFRCFSRHSSGLIGSDMRQLSAQLHGERPNQQLGVVGLCLTGAIPLALGTDDWVGAVVLSQPALPFAIGRKAGAAIAAAPCDIAQLRKRRVPVLALRFSQDAISPCARMLALCDQLGPQMKVLEIASGTDGKDISGSAHAVLTAELSPPTMPLHPTRVALQQTLDFLADNLLGQRPAPAPQSGTRCDWTVLGAQKADICSPSR